MSRTHETRDIKWHETCKCKCRLDRSVCNNKQRWNNDKCQCECKEFVNIKTLVFTTLGILQLKELMIIKIFMV